MAEQPEQPTQRGSPRRERAAPRRARRRRLAPPALPRPSALAAVVAIVAARRRRQRRSALRRRSHSVAAWRQARRGSEPGLVRNATPQPDWEPHTGPVPILEYHVLGAAPAGAPYPELYVTRPDFRQPDGLARRARLPGGDPRTGRGRLVPGRHPAAEAGRALLRRRLPAAVHLRPAGAAHATAGPACSTSRRKARTSTTSNVEAMIAAGWELASHTIDHLDLTDARRRRAGSEKWPSSRADPAPRIRRPGEELLLPGRPLRRDRDRRRRSRRLRRPRPPRSPATPSREHALRTGPLRDPRLDRRRRAWPACCARLPAPRAGPGSRRPPGAPSPRAPGRCRSGRSRRRGRRRRRPRRSPR